ncbi:Phenmedipham hydrolase [compost metagenome]
MNWNEKTAVVSLSSGLARGEIRNGVAVFRGLPYGERIAPSSRLSELRAPAPWQGERDATGPAAVFPQARSRLAAVMGDGIDANAQSEDAFVLSVWASAEAESAPVFVFIHGGGFMSGGGSAAWYDGERLAREGRMVVVSVNYRLGALGHYVEGGDTASGNRPVRDLLHALAWVQRHIHELGGDPAAVTVGGQSAGAWYAWLLGISPAARGLLRRNLLFSLPALPPQTPQEARATSEAFRAHANGLRFDSMPVAAVLAAQGELMRSLAGFGEIAVGFRPVEEEGLVPGWLFDMPRAAAAAHVDATLLGFTAEENTAFLCAQPMVAGASEARVRAWFDRAFGAQAGHIYDRLAAARATPTPYTQLVDGSSYKVFVAGSEQIAGAFSACGIPVFPYRFAVQSQVPGLMSPHCMELPFLFGNRSAWADAPMVMEVPEPVFERVGAAFRNAIVGFVRDGKPGPAQSWPAFVAAAPQLAEFREDGLAMQPWQPLSPGSGATPS